MLIAQERRWGIMLPSGSYLPIVLFANNFWLLATCPKMLSEMLAVWMRLLHKCGWTAPVEDMVWCTTSPDDRNRQVSLSMSVVKRSDRSVGFKALCTMVIFDCSNEAEQNFSIQRAWRSFHQCKDSLCDLGTQTLWDIEPASYSLLGLYKISRSVEKSSCLKPPNHHVI